jgi:uncharacterized protein YqgC (DUF456 family)
MDNTLHRKIVLLPTLLLYGFSAKQPDLLGGVELPAAMLIILQIVSIVLMIISLVGLFTYIIPGLTIIWLTALVYGFITGFSGTPLIYISIITVLMLFGNSLDQILMGARARKNGAKWSSIILSMLAAFIFSFLLPPFGGLVAALIVLFTLEYVRLRDLRKASGSTKEMAIGCASALAARFGVGLIMIGVWIVWVWQSGDLPF